MQQCRKQSFTLKVREVENIFEVILMGNKYTITCDEKLMEKVRQIGALRFGKLHGVLQPVVEDALRAYIDNFERTHKITL